MKEFEDYRQLLDSEGVSLASLGVADVALELADALLAVELLRKASLPVKGGDVYFQVDREIKLANANWYTQRIPGEDYTSYLHRSWKTATDYIRAFPEHSGKKAIFSLVVGEAEKRS